MALDQLDLDAGRIAFQHAGKNLPRRSARHRRDELDLGPLPGQPACGRGEIRGQSGDFAAPASGQQRDDTGLGREPQRPPRRLAIGDFRNGICQRMADELGVPLADVEVTTGDTRAFGYAVGTFASRAAVMSGSAVASSP